MKNKIRNKLLLIAVLIGAILAVNMLNFVSANINVTDPEYLKVLTEFNKTDRVSVIIGVASDDVREEVISSLSGTEITSISRSLLGKSFSGEITRQGLDKLINNSNIKWINLQAILTTGNNESASNITALPKNQSRNKIAINNLLLYLVGILIIIVIICIILKMNKKK